MRDQEILGLQEAYASIYTNVSESHFKVGDEVVCKASGMEGEVVKLDKPDGAEDEKYYTVKREDGKTMKYAPNELKLAKKEKEDEKEDVKEAKNGGATKKSETKFHLNLDKLVHKTFGPSPEEKKIKKEEVETDLFDYILEHLVAEGYADTNKAALAIMANMSEEWKESILDESRGAELRAKHGDNPSKKLETKAFGKAMRYDNRDRLPTGTGTEVRGRYLGLSGRARSRAGGETPASSAVGPDGKSRTVKSRGGKAKGIGAGENRDRPTG